MCRTTLKTPFTPHILKFVILEISLSKPYKRVETFFVDSNEKLMPYTFHAFTADDKCESDVIHLL